MFLPSTTCWSGSIADLSRPATMLFCLAELRSTCTIKVKVVIHLHLPVCHVTLMAFCWSSASSSANSSAWVIQSIYPAVYLLFICTYLGKPSKKKKCNIFYIWGGSGLVFVTLFYFFQKNGLKWSILHLKGFFFFFFGFSLHFPETRGGSDPSVKNVTLFFLKASLRNKWKATHFLSESQVFQLQSNSRVSAVGPLVCNAFLNPSIISILSHQESSRLSMKIQKV